MKLGMAPDLPEFGHEGLVKARNAYSGILGYEPIKALSAGHGRSALHMEGRRGVQGRGRDDIRFWPAPMAGFIA
jgi:hypothetical protein